MKGPVEVQGHQMYLDDWDTLRLAENDVWEPTTTHCIMQNIKKNDIVVDVGAMIGYYTLLFARLVGENGKVFAFEPDPTNFAILQRNVEINSYENVELIQKAVLDKAGGAQLYLSPSNYGDHRIYDSGESRKSVDIETIRLDDFFDSRVDFIKIDTQGAEFAILKGMPQLLKRNQDVGLIVEYHYPSMEAFGVAPAELLELLIKSGFCLRMSWEGGWTNIFCRQ